MFAYLENIQVLKKSLLRISEKNIICEKCLSLQKNVFANLKTVENCEKIYSRYQKIFANIEKIHIFKKSLQIYQIEFNPYRNNYGFFDTQEQ